MLWWIWPARLPWCLPATPPSHLLPQSPSPREQLGHLMGGLCSSPGGRRSSASGRALHGATAGDLPGPADQTPSPRQQHRRPPRTPAPPATSAAAKGCVGGPQGAQQGMARVQRHRGASVLGASVPEQTQFTSSVYGTLVVPLCSIVSYRIPKSSN